MSKQKFADRSDLAVLESHVIKSPNLMGWVYWRFAAINVENRGNDHTWPMPAKIGHARYRRFYTQIAAIDENRNRCTGHTWQFAPIAFKIAKCVASFRETQGKTPFQRCPSIPIPSQNQSRDVYLSCQRNSDPITAYHVCWKDFLSSQLASEISKMPRQTAMVTLNVRKARWVSKMTLARVASGQLSTGKPICSRGPLVFFLSRPSRAHQSTNQIQCIMYTMCFVYISAVR